MRYLLFASLFLHFLLTSCTLGPPRVIGPTIPEQSPAAEKTSGLIKKTDKQSLPIVNGVIVQPESKVVLPLVNWKRNVYLLIPDYVSDKDGWANDIFQAFSAQHLGFSKQNICASIAVVAQESSFHANPVVYGLPQIVHKELERRRSKYFIPKWAFDKAIETTSPDGKTYLQRINALRTENDINHLVEDMESQLPMGKQLLANYNPVHTGGPMQVSVKFAEDFYKLNQYPYVIKTSIRDEVFSRRGGVYFGIAHLLNYPVNYDGVKFYFADFNSGRYASRNAAFQALTAKITRRKISLDGDLLAYESGSPVFGSFESIVVSMSSRLNMSAAQIRSDLLLEKSREFEGTNLYKNMHLLGKAENIAVTYAVVPKIKLESPKITRKLTTEWFVGRVMQHYEACLARSL